MLSTEHNSIEQTVDEWAHGTRTIAVSIADGSIKITQVLDGTLGQVLVVSPEELPRLLTALRTADRALRYMKNAA